jgi:hypothetical protein
VLEQQSTGGRREIAGRELAAGLTLELAGPAPAHEVLRYRRR